MARKLTFQLNNQEFDLGINKLDRKKLYGFKETIAQDHEGNDCIKASIDDTGSLIIPKGGIALGIIDSDANWVNKADLKAVNLDGTDAQIVPSSFDAPISLKETVTIDEFLDYSIQYVYQLQSENDINTLIENIKNNSEIFTFTFNYRADYEGSNAFIIENDDKLFVLVGYKNNFNFIGLEESTQVSIEEDKDFSIEDDLDFGML